HQPPLLDAQLQRIRSPTRSRDAERIGVEQVENGHLALLLDGRAARHDAVHIERDGAETEIHSALFSRAVIERACASSPSASAGAMASGPSRAIASGGSDRMVVRFMNSSTDRPDEKRAVRDVGSTWFGPAM